IDVGELEGRTIEDYRAWKRVHRRDEAFPGGESLDDVARRYVRAFGRLLERPERSILVVCHEIPVRYALNAAAGSDELDGPAHARSRTPRRTCSTRVRSYGRRSGSRGSHDRRSQRDQGRDDGALRCPYSSCAKARGDRRARKTCKRRAGAALKCETITARGE